MGIKPSQTVTIVDDLDGKTEFQTETPDDHKVYFGWGGRRYEVYLSDASKEKVEKFLSPLIEHATDVTPVNTSFKGTPKKATARKSSGGTSATAGWDKTQIDALRAWAAGPGAALLKKADVKPPAERGRIAQAVVDLYNESN